MKKFLFFAILPTLILFTACSSPWMTNTSRSAIEQYLLSTTVERCFSFANFMNYSKKKVYMDYDYFAPQVDKQYAQGVIEARLASFGIIIVKKAEEADIIIQPLCGVLGTDHDKFIIGTPTLPIPLPNTNLNFAIPEIALFSKITRKAYGKFSILIFESKGRKPLETIENMRSSSTFTNWIIFLIPFKSHDIDMNNTVDGHVTIDFIP